MQDPTDTKTLALDLQRKAGRPAKYASAAERQAAYRARKGKAQVSIQLDPEVAELLERYLNRQRMDVDPEMTKSQVIEKLIRSQLLRKR